MDIDFGKTTLYQEEEGVGTRCSLVWEVEEGETVTFTGEPQSSVKAARQSVRLRPGLE